MRKKLLIIFCLLFLISGCSNNEPPVIDDPIVEPEDPVEEDPIISDKEVEAPDFLHQQLEEGAISVNNYVCYSVFGALDKSSLPAEYQNLDIDFDLQSALQYAGDHFDELEPDTKEALVSLITLSNLTFDDGSGSTAYNSFANALGFETVSASGLFGNKGAVITDVKVSSKGNFIIWYTEEGDSGISKEKVNKIAEQLESTVSFYDNLFGTQYRYEEELLVYDDILTKQSNILKKNGYDAGVIRQAMNVYIFNYSNDNSISGAYGWIKTLFEKIVALITPAENKGVCFYPYLVIDNEANVDDLKNTCAHELFHHYQNQVLPQDDQILKEAGTIGEEATAVWASFLACPYIKYADGIAVANTCYTQHLDDAFNFSGGKLPDYYVGYMLGSFVYNYQKNVSDSLTKIVDAIYVDDFVQYLHDHATAEERTAVMCELALHSYGQDYSNEAFNGVKDLPAVFPDELTSSSTIANKGINRMAVHYYTMQAGDLKSKKLTIQSDQNQIQMQLIRKTTYGTVSQLCKTDSSNQSIDLNAYANLDGEIILAVYNTSFVDASTYSLTFEKSDKSADTVNNYSLLSEAAVIADNEHIKVTVNDIRVKNGVLIFDCNVQNKTDKALSFWIDELYLNRYKVYTIAYGGSVDANASVDTVLASRNFDFAAFKPEEVSSIELSIGLKSKEEGIEKYATSLYQFKFNDNDTSLLDVYNSHLETARYSYSYIYGEENYSYSRVLAYEKNIYSDARCRINGLIILQDVNGADLIVMDVEKLSDQVIDSNDFTLTAVNGVETMFFTGYPDKVTAGYRQILTLSSLSITYKDRKACYGFDGVGSYEITLRQGSDILFTHTVVFGTESSSGGTLLFENEKCKLYLTGAVADYIQSDDDINLIFRIDLSDAQYQKDGYSFLWFDEVLNSIQVDGKIADDTYSNTVACDDGQSGFVQIELDDVDATQPHLITGEVSICAKKVPFSINYTPNGIE